MAVDQQTVTIDSTGPIPDLEIFFGETQAGRFSCYLQNKAGHQDLIREGGTATGGDSISFSVGQPAASLSGAYLCWDITVVSPTGGTNESFLVTVTIRQNGTTLKVIAETGAMTAAYQSTLLYVKFL